MTPYIAAHDAQRLILASRESLLLAVGDLFPMGLRLR
jgi:hypothetical protein